MTRVKKLPPKGVDTASAAATIMRSRFDHGDEEAAEEASAAPEQAPPTEAPAKRRGDAEGMTRRTYYLAEADADALEAAVDRLHDAVRGLIPKHRILGALISRGLVEVDAVEAELRDELIAGLTGGSAESPR